MSEADKQTSEQPNEQSPVEEVAEVGMEEVVIEEQDSCQQELQELTNRLLRVQADFDNFRKRSRQEREEIVAYANARLIEDMLPVLDTFRMAMSVTNGDVETLKQGIDMVYRQLVGVLEGQGLQQLTSVGQPFDPVHHEAIMQVPDSEQESGIVVEELRTGYKLRDRVIRPAMVKVAE